MTFNEIVKKNRDVAAKRLSKKIRVASRIAKVATKASGRRSAYKLTAKLLQDALKRFPSFCRPISFEYDRGGLVVSLVLFDRNLVHLPLAEFGTMRPAIDLNKLPYRETLGQKRR